MYYAIRKGVQTGVFESWDVCKSYIHGFRGAEFKKFKTKQEALHYLTNEPNDNLANETNEGIYVYCDGSCIHNGQSRAKASIGIYFGEDDVRNVSKPIEGRTNNVAELVAMIEVYGLIQENKKINEL